MSATTISYTLDQYVAHSAVHDFLAVFEQMDESEDIHDVFGSDGPENVVDNAAWNYFNPSDDPAAHVEFADARAALIGARMCRILLDDPALLRIRASHLEKWAAGVFAKFAPSEGGAS